jgi:hypothetical protein
MLFFYLPEFPLQDMQNTELNSNAHQPDSSDKADLDLHGLCNGELDVVIDILGKELPEADIPNIKLINKFSVLHDTNEQNNKSDLFKSRGGKTVHTQNDCT